MSVLRTAAAWLVEPADHDASDEIFAARPRRAATWPIAPPDAEPDARVLIPRPADLPAARRARSLASIPDALTRPAVLGAADAVLALAAATALACRARSRVPAALVALWRPPGAATGLPGPGGGPVLPGAAALAGRLSRRDLAVAARGRIVWLRLPGDDEQAVATLRRAEAAVGDLPAVLAVSRPRDATVDTVLADRDLIFVAADDDSALAVAATADTAPLGVPIRVCRPIPPGAARLAALAGLRGPRLEPIRLTSGSRDDRNAVRRPRPAEGAW
jgi:hypothetical protein